MEEKILIQSQAYNIKKLRKIFLIIGIGFAVIWLLIGSLFAILHNLDDIKEECEYYEECYITYSEHLEKYGSSIRTHAYTVGRWGRCYDCMLILEYPTKSSYIIDEFFFQPFELEKTIYFIILGIILVLFIIIPLILYFALHSYQLIVTDKKVYGKTTFGKQVDLPLDSISAISKNNFLKGVSISTSSGRIKFLVLKNSNDIYDMLTQLLLNRQENKAPNISQNNSLDIPELLLKYKKLLDEGIITQEEYETKKSDLLK